MLPDSLAKWFGFDLALQTPFYYNGKEGAAIHALRRSLVGNPADPVVRNTLIRLEESLDLRAQVNAVPPLNDDLLFVFVALFFNLFFLLLSFLVVTRKAGFLIFLVLLGFSTLGCLGALLYSLKEGHTPIGVVAWKGSSPANI